MTGAESHPPVAAPRPASWPMFRAVVGVGIICSLAIVVVYEVTRPIIETNRIAMLERAVIEVLPRATSSSAFRLTDDGSFEPTGFDSEGELVYAGYNDDKALVGIAMVAEGMGYQDVVRILYGYSPPQEAVVGISVLESRETPGLGDRVETDPIFQSNFEQLDVRLQPDGAALVHAIEFVKPGEKEEAWQIDGISGATITSQAIADMLRRHCGTWIARVHPREADFQFKEGGKR